MHERFVSSIYSQNLTQYTMGTKHQYTMSSKQASPRPATLRATAPVGGGDGVLSKLLLVLRVDGTHQK